VKPSEYRAQQTVRIEALKEENIRTVKPLTELRLNAEGRFKSVVKTILTGSTERENKLNNGLAFNKKSVDEYRKIAQAQELELADSKRTIKTLKGQVMEMAKQRDDAFLMIKGDADAMQSLREIHLDLVASKMSISDTTVKAYKEKGNKYNAVNFVMFSEGCEFKDAVILLNEHFPNSRGAVTTHVTDLIEISRREKVRKEAFEEVHKYEGDPQIISRQLIRADDVKISLINKQLSAIDTDRFRITLIDAYSDQGINIGKSKDGVERFYTKDEIIEELIPTMSYYNARDRHVYVTPMPTINKHFILLDDIVADNLERARKLEPCLILQTSPGSHQALYLVNGDKRAVNTVFKELNKEFGDPKISGLIHPMRLAGFTNCKEKHKDRHGNSPFVKIIEANIDVTSHTLTQRASEMQQVMALVTSEERMKYPKITLENVCKTDKEYAATAEKMYTNCINYYKNDVDLSKIDFRVAELLAGIGCTRESTKQIIEQLSPNIAVRHPDVAAYTEGKTKDLTYAAKTPALAAQKHVPERTESELGDGGMGGRGGWSM
jgi:hypothetical protein